MQAIDAKENLPQEEVTQTKESECKQHSLSRMEKKIKTLIFLVLILSSLIFISILATHKAHQEEIQKPIINETLTKSSEIVTTKPKHPFEDALSEGLENYVEGQVPLYVDDILIVNKDFNLPSNFTTKLQREVTEQFNIMKEDARKDGLIISLKSGFRNNAMQRTLYNGYIQKFGIERASRSSAKPGHSEHESGLAIDISNGSSANIGSWFNDTPQAKWLYENAHKYGFILRYPEGKEDITGYKYEAWHYRYVSLKHSVNFNQNNLTLEEYVGLTQKNN